LVGGRGGEVVVDEGAVYECAVACYHPFRVVSVLSVVEGGGEAVQDVVGVDVAAEVEEVCVVIDVYGFDGAFEDGAAVLVFEVVDFAVAVEDTLGQQAGAGECVLADEEVVMVGQEDVGDDGDAVF